MLKVGLKHSMEFIVQQQDTAAALDSGTLEVLATPRLIAWMEAAACEAVRGKLQQGTTTVGTAVDMKHKAATAVGKEVRVEAELVEMDGRRLSFCISAMEAEKQVASAMHERFIVDINRFLEKVGKA